MKKEAQRVKGCWRQRFISFSTKISLLFPGELLGIDQKKEVENLINVPN